MCMKSPSSDFYYAEKSFGVVLRVFRTSAGISQEQLALKAGLDRTYISLLERGLRQPTINTFLGLCHVMEVSPIIFMEALQIEISSTKPKQQLEK